jgi:ribonuclease P protein component
MIGLKVSNRDPRRPYRVAVVVSKKVHKSAVMRNRIRRRVYEVVRRNSQAIAPGTDLIFTVFSETVAEIDAGKLESLVMESLQQAARKQP